MTLIDLAIALNVAPARVEKVLKRRFGKLHPEDRLTEPQVEFARRTLGKAAPRAARVAPRSSAPAPPVAPVQRAAPPLAPRAAAPPPAPAAPTEPVATESPGLARHFEKRLETALAELAAARASLDEAERRGDALAQQVASLRAAARTPTAPVATPPTSEAASLSGVLDGLGFRADRQGEVLAAALAHRPVARRLLPLLRVEAPADAARVLTEGVLRVCVAADCRRMAEADRVARVAAQPATTCAYCGGSDNGRAYATMSRACAAARVRRVVVVGGGDDSRADVRRRTLDWPAPEIVLVEGNRRPDSARAKAKAQGADLVVLWGSTIVSHAETDVWKAAAEAAGTPVITVGGGQKGVASLARGIAEWVERYSRAE